jgi:hypothetical protein
MFSDEVKPLGSVPPAGDEAPKIDLSLYNVTELLALRGRIESMLPPLTMGGINLEQELAVQFQTVKALQSDTLSGNEDSTKKASMINACASSLQHIIKMQNELHNSERFKALETLLIRYMKRLPKEVVDQFLDDYANLVEG